MNIVRRPVGSPTPPPQAPPAQAQAAPSAPSAPAASSPPFDPGRVPAGVDIPNLPIRENVQWNRYDGQGGMTLRPSRLRTDGPAPDTRMVTNARSAFRSIRTETRNHIRQWDQSPAAESLRREYRQSAAGFESHTPGMPTPPAYENGEPPPYMGTRLGGGEVLIDHSVDGRFSHGGSFMYREYFPSESDTLNPLNPESNFRPAPPYNLPESQLPPQNAASVPQPPTVVPPRQEKSESAFQSTGYQTQENQMSKPPPDPVPGQPGPSGANGR